MNFLNLPVSTINLKDVIVITNPLRKHMLSKSEKESGATYPQTIVEMAQSIKDRGLINKFSVAPVVDPGTGETKYRLADGYRRYLGLSLLRDEGYFDGNVDVSMLPENISDIDLLAIQVAGNANIETTQDSAFVEALFRIMREKNLDVHGLSKTVGITVNRIMKLMGTLSLPVDVRVYMDGENPELTVDNAIVLAQYYHSIDEDLKPAALDFAINEKSSKLAEKLAELKSNSNKNKDEKIEFVATPKFIGKKDAEALYETYRVKAEDEELNEFEQGSYAILKQLFSMDEETIRRKKADFDYIKNESKRKSEAAKQKKLDSLKKALEKAELSEDDIKALIKN